MGIVSMLNEQVGLEREVESAKTSLVNHPDFNTYDCFRMFDIDGRGSLNASDIRYGLADIGVTVSDEDVRLFIDRHDKDGDGRLDYREF